MRKEHIHNHGDSRIQEEVERQFTDKDKLGINNSIAAHIRWRKTYKASVEGRLSMITTCPTTEAVEYLRIEWAKYEPKCRDIKIGTSILMGKDPTVVELIMVGVEEQAKEYQILTNQMGKILKGLTKIKRDGQATAAAANPQADKEPKIKKELCPDTLTKDSTPIEFRKFQRDFLVYYKESYMDKASPEGQKHSAKMHRRRIGRKALGTYQHNNANL